VRSPVVPGDNAQLVAQVSTDMRGRAQLDEDCPALDFYNGFYLTPQNGKVCAKRDDIHSRMGRSCRIERFRRLVPKEPR